MHVGLFLFSDVVLSVCCWFLGFCEAWGVAHRRRFAWLPVSVLECWALGLAACILRGMGPSFGPGSSCLSLWSLTWLICAGLHLLWFRGQLLMQSLIFADEVYSDLLIDCEEDIPDSEECTCDAGHVLSVETSDAGTSSVRQGHTARCLRRWIKLLQSSRFCWVACRIGLGRRSDARMFKHKLSRGSRSAAVRLLYRQGLMLARGPSESTRARRVVPSGHEQNQGTQCAVPGMSVAWESSMPSLRGGASNTDRLLKGLSALLAAEGDEEDSSHENECQALVHALEELLRRRPVNLPQELKSVVQKFNRPQKPEVPAQSETPTNPKGKGKGKGKSKSKSSPSGQPGTGATAQKLETSGTWALDSSVFSPGAAQQSVDKRSQPQEESWATVCVARVKRPSPKQRSDVEAGRPRACDWSGPVATSAIELEKTLAMLTSSGGKAVVALAPNSEEAELMWELIGSHQDVDCLFSFNYDTQDRFVRETEKSLGVAPTLLTVPLNFCKGLRFVKRYGLRRGDGAPKPKITNLTLEAEATAKSSTVVLRAKSRKGFLSKWDTVSSNPGLGVRQWCGEINNGAL